MTRMTRGAAAVLVAAVLLASCTTNAEGNHPAAIANPAATTTQQPTEEPTMTTPSDVSADEVAIRDVSDRQTAAMVVADIAALDDLLADGFSLTHITGYQQPKDEWLTQIASGDMTYHAAEEVFWTVTVDGDTALVRSRARLDATIYGTRRVWPLAFTTHLHKSGGRWLVEKSIATTDRN